MPHFLYTHFIW